MQVVQFSFREGIGPDRVAQVLQRVIPAISGVVSAGHLKADSRNERVRRMCHARCDDSVPVNTVLKALREIPELEHVESPARRGLVDG